VLKQKLEIAALVYAVPPSSKGHQRDQGGWIGIRMSVSKVKGTGSAALSSKTEDREAAVAGAVVPTQAINAAPAVAIDNFSRCS